VGDGNGASPVASEDGEAGVQDHAEPNGDSV
jgi:hypothetical protein